MSRIISRAEGWEKAYEAFTTVNFSSFDYDTIKASMLEYIKLYFPEDFNDYIESSEFIALLELFAYVGELLSYRLDMNAHENFLSTAQRKESILRLAKLISYNPTRNITARGLVKITAITTTETIYDSSGTNLTNRRIRWNDVNNPNWKEQFLLVMNRTMNQDFGSVSPENRIQVDDVLFELYSLNNNTINNGVFAYSATVSGESVPMELVPSALDEYGPYEKRPEIASNFTFLYGSDGLGDGSTTTGFFVFTKQGTLQYTTETFDGVTPNQTSDILVDNINETDLWVNNIDPNSSTLDIVDDGSSTTGRSGEWHEVDLAHAQNIIFNTNPNRNKYEVETLADDQVRIIFGDGEFANIPAGTFHFWYRTSLNRDIVIPQNSVVDRSSNFTYQGADGNTQTLTFTFSLISSLQNGSPSEDIEHVRRTAPAVYYTQDRMVNGRDYNTFMLQDSTILKLRAVNRTYAGDSKYIDWHDPSETYENVKIFGDDLALYFKNSISSVVASNILNVNQLILNYIQPLLSSTDFFTIFTSNGIASSAIRREFTPTELANITNALTNAAAFPPTTVELYYDKDTDDWLVDTTGGPNTLFSLTNPMISVTADSATSWTIEHQTERLVAESQATRFWNTNDANRVVFFDSLDSVGDNIVVLKANQQPDGLSLMSQNWDFNVLGQEIVEVGQSDAGLPSIHHLSILPTDTTEDGIPDNMTLTEIVTIPPVDDYDYVYFHRESVTSPWLPKEATAETIANYTADLLLTTHLWARKNGRYPLNFAWFHRTSQYRLIDPSSTNIIDIFIIPRGYYTSVRQWLDGKTTIEPTAPTPLDLRTSYSHLLDNKMISDTVVLHPGRFRYIFGSRAPAELQAKFKVIRSQNSTLTNSQIKVNIIQAIKQFFDINVWEFGETFYFTELATSIHNTLLTEIDSVILVPTSSRNQFGDMFQVFAREDEILQPSISVSDIDIVESFTPDNMRQDI